jgi:hypothetical protein
MATASWRLGKLASTACFTDGLGLRDAAPELCLSCNDSPRFPHATLSGACILICSCTFTENRKSVCYQRDTLKAIK